MYSSHRKMLMPCCCCISSRSTSELPGLMSEKQKSETPLGPSTLAGVTSESLGGGRPEMTPFFPRLPVGALPVRKQRYQSRKGPAFFTQLHALHLVVPWQMEQHFSGPITCLMSWVHLSAAPSKVYSTLASMRLQRRGAAGSSHFSGTQGEALPAGAPCCRRPGPGGLTEIVALSLGGAPSSPPAPAAWSGNAEPRGTTVRTAA
mmetsp:Transcript_625/g.1959  ORF Transcript_625/g.1959 Transcript_625/m.1959 type:complete len:204 (-) Transcript_625:464-1075(-)